MAFCFEDEYKSYKESHPKGKAKISAPRFSITKVPSSNSFGSSGKKRKAHADTSVSGRHSFAKKSNARFSQAGYSGGLRVRRSFFLCGQLGHLATQCPHQQQALVNMVYYSYGKLGHVQRNCLNLPKRARDAPHQPTR